MNIIKIKFLKYCLFALTMNKSTDSIPNYLFLEIERTINQKTVDHSYFDIYIEKYPNSDYLNGMKLFYLISERKDSEANEYLEKINGKVNKGTFIIMSQAQLIKNNKNKYLAFLKKAYNKDYLKQNKYVRFLLFDYYYNKDFNIANKFLNEALEIDSNYIVGLVEKANVLKNQGRINSSIEMLDKAININGDAFACYYRSMFYSDKKEYDKAEELLRLGLKNKRIPEIYCALGYISNVRGDNEKELEFYQNGLQIDSANKFVLSRLGWFYVSKEDFVTAKFYFDKMAISEPKFYKDDYYPLIYTNIVLYNYEESQKLINKFRKNFDNDFQIDFFQILLFSLQKKISKSENLIDVYYKTYDEDKILWLNDELMKWNITIK